MNKTWIVYCDECGAEIILQYPPRDMIYICEDCEENIDDYYNLG